MTFEQMKKYPAMIVIKKDTQARIEKLKREIERLDKRMGSRKRPRDKEGNIIDLAEIKRERLEVTEKLLEKLEASTLEVEEAVADAAPDLTPLELIIITKLYIEGLKWVELIDLLQTDEKYAKFCYERSTYMRAHRSALKKLMKTGPTYQKTKPDCSAAESRNSHTP